MAKENIIKIKRDPIIWKTYLPIIPQTGFDFQNI